MEPRNKSQGSNTTNPNYYLRLAPKASRYSAVKILDSEMKITHLQLKQFWSQTFIYILITIVCLYNPPI